MSSLVEVRHKALTASGLELKLEYSHWPWRESEPTLVLHDVLLDLQNKCQRFRADSDLDTMKVSNKVIPELDIVMVKTKE